MDAISEMSTPNLVHLYMQLHVEGSHKKLPERRQEVLSRIVDELRARKVLD